MMMYYIHVAEHSFHMYNCMGTIFNMQHNYTNKDTNREAHSLYSSWSSRYRSTINISNLVVILNRKE